MAQYGAIKHFTATGTTSFPTANPVLVQSMVVNTKSDASGRADVYSSGTAGHLVIPVRIKGTAGGKAVSSMYFGYPGVMTENAAGAGKQGFVKISGASTAATIFYRTA